MPKILDLLTAAGVDLAKARKTVINWINQLVAIVDGYRGFRGVPHGVQKDAIQNMWDARTDKKGKGWSARFELLTSPNGHTYLCMADTGTTGLTGKVLQPEELIADLPPDERWGRFENVAFTKDPYEEALGARGRGKFIFVGASKVSTIIYDTLRPDGVYRLGIRTIQLTDSPIFSYEGSEAHDKLKLLTDGVCAPLSQVGTRVIIVDPIDELLEDIKAGRFAGFIGETWWEIISKFKSDIQVIAEGKVWQAKVPDEFILPEKDSKDYKVWIKAGDKLKVSKHEYRIKRLHIVRSIQGPVPDDLRGIALQRGGMKVCTIHMRYVPAEVAESVYGNVTLERELERAILPHENPEHYSFDWSKPVPRELRRYIEGELEAFGREKLGLGVDPAKVKSQQQRNAELRALYSINRIAKKLGLLGGGGGGGDGGGGDGAEPKDFKVGVLVTFPRETHRVNYGEELNGIRLIAHNNTKHPVKVQLHLVLEYQGQEVKKFIQAQVPVPAQSKHEVGPSAYKFKKGSPKGEYRLQGIMISMRSTDKGKELARAAVRLWVEQDPPERGIFERIEGLEYKAPKDKLMADHYKADGKGYVFTYNVNHPAYEQESEADGEENLTDYLVKLMAYEVARIDMSGSQPHLFEKDDLESPQVAALKTAEIVGSILHEFYST
jgi:hypothetical protein